MKPLHQSISCHARGTRAPNRRTAKTQVCGGRVQICRLGPRTAPNTMERRGSLWTKHVYTMGALTLCDVADAMTERGSFPKWEASCWPRACWWGAPPVRAKRPNFWGEKERALYTPNQAHLRRNRRSVGRVTVCGPPGRYMYSILSAVAPARTLRCSIEATH